MTSSSQNPFGADCPEGGDWQACGNGPQFLGCCTVDACNDQGCPTEDVQPATFDASQFGQFPDQACTQGQWFVCANNDPPFMGCCTSNPCTNNGCPASDLRAGALSNNITNANFFNPNPPLSSATSSTSISSATSTSSATVSPTVTSATSATPVARPSAAPKIAGGVAGGLAGLFLFLAFVIWRWKRYMRASRRELQDEQERRIMAAMRRPDSTGNYMDHQFSQLPTFTVSSHDQPPMYPSNLDPRIYGATETGALLHSNTVSPPSSVGQLSRETSPQVHASQWSNLLADQSQPPTLRYVPYSVNRAQTSSLLATRYQAYEYAQASTHDDARHGRITELAGANENL